MRNGFIKVSRSILNWRWYKDHNTKVLFLYLLYQAAWRPCKDNGTGVEVDRGECFLSVRKVAADTGMGDKSVRTALTHLETGGTIKCQAGPAGTLVRLLRYEQYQSKDSISFIMLPRAFVDWDWKKGSRALLLFLHILLQAEMRDGENELYPFLNRGQVHISVKALTEELGQKKKDQAMRADLKTLQSCGLIKMDTTTHGSLIDVRDVDKYLGAATNAGRIFDAVTNQITNRLPPVQQTEPEILTNQTANQITSQLSFENLLGKPKTDVENVTSGKPNNKPDGKPNTEKWQTTLSAGGKSSGKPSLYKEELKKNGRGEEYACAREAPSPSSPADVAFAEAAFAAMPSCASPGEDAKGRTSRLDAEQVAALYTELCPSLPTISMPLTKYRWRAVEQLLAQYPDETLIRRIFQKAEDSDYLKGCDNYGWKADFDWLIDLRHVPRILEGAYDHLWESKKRGTAKGGYAPADSQPPTYDMGEYVDYSMKRILGG